MTLESPKQINVTVPREWESGILDREISNFVTEQIPTPQNETQSISAKVLKDILQNGADSEYFVRPKLENEMNKAVTSERRAAAATLTRGIMAVAYTATLDQDNQVLKRYKQIRVGSYNPNDPASAVDNAESEMHQIPKRRGSPSDWTLTDLAVLTSQENAAANFRNTDYNSTQIDRETGDVREEALRAEEGLARALSMMKIAENHPENQRILEQAGIRIGGEVEVDKENFEESEIYQLIDNNEQIDEDVKEKIKIALKQGKLTNIDLIALRLSEAGEGTPYNMQTYFNTVYQDAEPARDLENQLIASGKTTAEKINSIQEGLPQIPIKAAEEKISDLTEENQRLETRNQSLNYDLETHRANSQIDPATYNDNLNSVKEALFTEYSFLERLPGKSNLEAFQFISSKRNEFQAMTTDIPDVPKSAYQVNRVLGFLRTLRSNCEENIRYYNNLLEDGDTGLFNRKKGYYEKVLKYLKKLVKVASDMINECHLQKAQDSLRELENNKEGWTAEVRNNEQTIQSNNQQIAAFQKAVQQYQSETSVE
jgi:hypothetical protein